MSVHVSSWAWQQKVNDPSAKLLLVKLADNANDDGVCWPGQQRLAEETELSVRTVTAKVQVLVGLGLVEVQHRKQNSNLYFLMCRSRVPNGQGTQISHPRNADLAYKPSVEPSVVEPSIRRNAKKSSRRPGFFPKGALPHSENARRAKELAEQIGKDIE